jgi:SAM-dependent methyltransferase
VSGLEERIEVLRNSRRLDGVFLEHYFRYRFAAGLVRSRTVLDCACGTGYGSFILAQKAKRVVGVDIDGEATAIARREWSKPNIEYRLADFHDLDGRLESFDVAVSFETIEHVAEPEYFLDKLGACLTGTGSLIVSTPNRLEYRKGLPPNPCHIREFTADEFRDMLNARFRSVQLFGQLRIREDDGSIAAGPALRWRRRSAEILSQSSLGYAVYRARMRRRFEIVPFSSRKRYCYFVAVCRGNR